MTSRTADLIARIEAAPEGSRSLSDECLLAVGCKKRKVGGVLFWDMTDGRCLRHDKVPDPSQNLQDALDWMVPEGWAIARMWQAAKTKDRPWWGIQLRRDEPYLVLPSVLGPKTAALAASAASLRALEKEKSDG